MVIVSDDAFNRNPRYTKVLVVHLTSSKRAGGPYEWEVEIARGTGGLDRGSIAKCAEVYTLYKEQLEAVAGTLPPPLMRNIDRALAVALGLPSAGAD